MATISRLSVSLTANAKGLKRGLRSARRSVANFTKKILNLKSAIVGAIGIGSLGALTKTAISAFAKQEQAVAKLDVSIKSMQRNTKGLSRTIQDLASQIQREGIIGDEAIIEGTSFLTTYKDITDELLPRTIRVMADLSAKMGGDTSRAANLLGKASMGLVGALSIAGISLSDATKKSKNFKDILREVEEQVSGVNAAMGSTASGALTKFSNAMGDLQEVLGGIIAVAIEPFIATLTFAMGGAGKSMKEINVLGEKFRSWLIQSAKDMTVLADAWAGLKLVWLGLKIVFSGFVLAITAGVHTIATGLNAISGFFGLRDFVAPDLMQGFEDALLMQSDNVRDLKSEITAMVESLGEEPPSLRLKAEIDRRAFQAEVDLMRNRLGLQPGGTFRKDPVKPKSSPSQTVHTRDPQLSDTNKILMDIKRDLRSRHNFAVAG